MSKAPKVNDRLWEDALILAFRDMQWIDRVLRSGLSLEEIAGSPGLMLKLDGNAETAAGDVIASHEERFFLFEFKSNLGHLAKERAKRVYARIRDARAAYNKGTMRNEDEQILRGAVLGHYLVFPRSKNGVSFSRASVPLHQVDLRCVSYQMFTKLLTAADLHSRSRSMRKVFYGKKRGLSLEEMSKYLSVLATVDGTDDSDFPLNAAVASTSGLFWPPGQITDLRNYIQHLRRELEQLRQRDEKGKLQRKSRHSVSEPGSDRF